MRSKHTKVRVPTPLVEVVERRAIEAGYESVSEWLVGLMRYDLLTRRPHETTANLSKLSRAEQDKVDDEILKMFTTNETLGGSWFENVVKRAVKAAAKKPPTDRMVGEILARVRNGKLNTDPNTKHNREV